MENLLRQRDELKAKIGELDRLSTTGTEKILQAIQNQRWFFFSNNKYILMDRDTALIWANLDYFPHERDSIAYSCTKNYAEVKTLMTQINSQRWGGFGGWKLPTFDEFKRMIADKTFPFRQGDKWQILGKSFWCVDYGSFVTSIYLSGEKITWHDFDCRVLSCRRSLVPRNFSATAREVLDIFTRNNLVPIFHDAETTRLYKKIYVDKVTDEIPRMTNQIAELDKKIAAAKKLADEERNLATAVTQWRESNLRFETGLLGELQSVCQKENFDEKIFTAWREEWRAKRFDAEQKFLSLIAFALNENLSDATADTLKILREYLDAVDRFYLLERTKIFLQAANEVQEKSAVTAALDKLTEQFRFNLQKIISACNKTDERNFLRKWSESPAT